MDRKKVLLVDDVELFLELEKTFFRREEVELQIARSGRQAVEIVLKEHPDLVFMDLFMPEMDGDAACLEIKRNPATAGIPVVMVTHGGREADLERCRAACCDEILLKPINRHLFMDTARRFLNMADRQSPRVPSRISVRYGANGEHELNDFALNLSTGGLFLEKAAPLAAGTRLTLEFPLPGRPKPVRCRARVAWVNRPERSGRSRLPAGMGVQFLDLGLDELQAIREFVKQECLSPSL